MLPDAYDNAATGTVRNSVAGASVYTDPNGSHTHGAWTGDPSANHQHPLTTQSPGTDYQAPGTNWKGGTGSPQSDGAGAAHENMPPYILIGLIIKVTGAQIDGAGALVGPQGVKGDPGPWRGTWSAATAYAVGDAVSYFNGLVTASYRRKVAGTTAGTPAADTTNWELIASGGSIGEDGAVAVYEQAGTPTEPVEVGAVWIDTDAAPPAWASGCLDGYELADQPPRRAGGLLPGRQHERDHLAPALPRLLALCAGMGVRGRAVACPLRVE